MGLEIDQFLERHLHSSKVINGKYVKYTQDELKELCKLSVECFSKEGTLVHLNPPCVVVGDIHGQFYDLLRMFSTYSVKADKEKPGVHGALATKYMFLGDYIDRGRHSLECLCMVLSMKIRYPEKYQVLRGNHECVSINRVYGFYDELVDRFGTADGEKLWDMFNEVFNCMPLAGLIGKKILCMHGGISPDLKSLEAIDNIQRPLADPASIPLALDLLWSDPMENLTGFRPNSVRGVSVFFGSDEVTKCCRTLDIKMIVRGHQMMTTGFGIFADKKLMTIFTAPRYQADNPNSGATLLIDANGRVGINVLKAPAEGSERKQQGSDSSTPKSDSGSCFFNREEEGAKRKRTGPKAPAKKSAKK